MFLQPIFESATSTSADDPTHGGGGVGAPSIFQKLLTFANEAFEEDESTLIHQNDDNLILREGEKEHDVLENDRIEVRVLSH